MSDELERASDLENAEREAALTKHRNRPAAPQAVGRGYCLNCFEDFEGDNTRLYCDGKCSQQHAIKLSRK